MIPSQDVLDIYNEVENIHNSNEIQGIPIFNLPNEKHHNVLSLQFMVPISSLGPIAILRPTDKLFKIKSKKRKFQRFKKRINFDLPKYLKISKKIPSPTNSTHPGPHTVIFRRPKATTT